MYQEIINLTKQFTLTSPLNRVEDLNNMRIYDPPLIAVADANDPLFVQLKNDDIVGNDHKSPFEWQREAKSVIAYFLPYTEKVRVTNRGDTMPSMEWLYGRFEGEEFNKALSQYLVNELTKKGMKVVSPFLDPSFKINNRKSNWSERHVAFIAGLGTFSLSKSLITAKGAAGRLGSVIVDTELSVTNRPYTHLEEYCIFCELCIDRCPPEAITSESKDHLICADFIDNKIRPKYKPRYGCGKCQTAVPCESKIPVNVK
ncbi:Iron-sulfur cluster-binding protein [Candidatus Syntrophocurvum alkaliphilum]|uniref:Iron-sulfur cluster-binding protein n=1 Tax=Candidatus Syntrophocurvum alkaliphilum TaxID=2293317 RepID=A0A6I6D5C5_9FIRM|nr:4Fe-4S binding protein [Candidatus Syntrophocurvum alkaliphilum]QGT98616.1 Iron-sulfur cluster-binding protein [Candidatus Syntrophocurvum alkaliphilum]